MALEKSKPLDRLDIGTWIAPNCIDYQRFPYEKLICFLLAERNELHEIEFLSILTEQYDV